MMHLTRILIWALPGFFYVLFWLWYTPLSGPMTAKEIDAIVVAAEESGADLEALNRITQFFEEDDGRSFIIVNLLDLDEYPETLPVTGPDASAQDLLDHYLEFMSSELLERASHPVFSGRSLFEGIDVFGIEGAENWDRAALMRYRSRRDLWEIASHPSFQDRHDYKIAALEKTIAFPVAPQLWYSDLRLIFALTLLALAGVLDAILGRRRG